MKECFGNNDIFTVHSLRESNTNLNKKYVGLIHRWIVPEIIEK